MKDFEEWMESEEGLQSREALDYVFEMLGGAEADVDDKRSSGATDEYCPSTKA